MIVQTGQSIVQVEYLLYVEISKKHRQEEYANNDPIYQCYVPNYFFWYLLLLST